MKSAFRWLLGLIIVLVVVAFGVFGPFQRYTAQRRDAAVERIRATLARYAIEPKKSDESKGLSAQDTAQKDGDDSAPRAMYDGLAEQLKTIQESDRGGEESSDKFAGGREALTPEERAAAKAYLDKASALIPEIRRLAPLSRTLIERYQSDDSHKSKSPDSTIRAFARLLGADARMNAARGALDESISDLAAIMEFSDAYAAGTKPFDRFVRNAIEERVFNTTPVVFGADTVTEAQINEIAAQLPRSYAREAFAHSLSNETSEVLEELDRMRETGEGAEGMIQGARLGAFAGSYASGRPMPGEFEFFLQSVEYRLYASPLGRPWQNLDEQAYADSMGHVIEAAALPFYQAVPDPAAFDQDNGGGLGGFSNVRASRTLAVQATYEAKLDLTRMGLMLQRYRVQYGAYPISLDAIATDMGGALPLDPFSGASYIYRPSGDSFLLYSVGYNRQDDGGTEGLHYDGDIVWRGGRALRSSDGVEP